MPKSQKISLFLLRLAMGALCLYAGITKVIDPAWTAAGYIKGASTFAMFYQWMLNPAILPVINFMNAWGLTLLGVSLLLGAFVRLSSYLGIALMLLYYFALSFPYPNAHALIVDEHIIYATVLLVLAQFRAGRVWGLDPWCAKQPVCAKNPWLKKLIG